MGMVNPLANVREVSEHHQGTKWGIRVGPKSLAPRQRLPPDLRPKSDVFESVWSSSSILASVQARLLQKSQPQHHDLMPTNGPFLQAYRLHLQHWFQSSGQFGPVS